MKKIVSLIFLGIAINCTYAQTQSLEHDLKVTLNVLDDNGKPVSGVTAIVYYMLTNSIVGQTDTNGIFVAAHRDQSWDLAFETKKAGYYPSRVAYHLGFYYKWEKWNPNATLTMRKIGNPIPMYAKKQEMQFPKLDEQVGFDLMNGDWVSPYGKGEHTDIYFTAHRKIISSREYIASLTVSFPQQGDGIAVAPKEFAVGSQFTTSRVAETNGYEPKMLLNFGSSKPPEAVFGYFIRVRTSLNADGSIRGACYGKICGNFRFFAGTIAPTSGIAFDYYLNPTPNDRNVEFDPKRNLVTNLKSKEGVTEP